MSNHTTPDQFPDDDRICKVIEWLVKQNTKEDYLDFLLVELAEGDNVYSFCRLLAVLEAKQSISLKGVQAPFYNGSKDHDNK